MADTSAPTGWSGFLGQGVGDLANYFGNKSATNALTGAEQNAINTQTGTQGKLADIYGAQRGLGTGADMALGSQLGLGGTPNYSAFNNSPGYQFALAQGDQAINRQASANGSLYTPNTMAMLSQYNTGYASQNYNNYISQLMGAAGLGAQGNTGLAQGVYNSGANVSQLQQNQGNARAGGQANATGIASNLLGKVPWGSVGSTVGGWFGGGGAADMASYFGSDYGTGAGLSTAADLGGYGADGASNIWDMFGGGFNGAGGQAATAGRPQQQSPQQQQSNPIKTASDLYGYYNKATKAYNFLTGAGNIGASAGAAVSGLGAELAASTAAAEGGVASSVAASNAAWLAAQPAAASAIGAPAAAAAAAPAAGAAPAAAGSLGLGLAGVGLAAAPAIYGASRNPVDLHKSYWQGMDKTLQGGKSDPQYWNTVTQLLGMTSQDPINSPEAQQMLDKYGINFYQNPNVTQGAAVSRVGSRPTQKY